MIYHTSPHLIENIYDGLFGKAICFASSPYFMSVNPMECWIYSIELTDLNILEANHIFYDENSALCESVVIEIMNKFNIDRNQACDLLDQTIDYKDLFSEQYFLEYNFEDDFWLQLQRYNAALLMGYDSIEQKDEQGTMWMLSIEKIINQKPIKYKDWLD